MQMVSWIDCSRPLTQKQGWIVMNASARIILAVSVVVAGIAGLLVGRLSVPPQDSAKTEKKTTPTETDARETSAPQVPEQPIREPLAVEGAEILDLLGSRDPHVRQKALELLQVWKPDALAERLPSILENETDGGCLLVALSAAGKSKSPETHRIVLRKLTSRDVAVRRQAAGALGELGEVLDESRRDHAATAIAAALDKELNDASIAGRPMQVGIYMPYLTALGKVKAKPSCEALLKHLRLAKQPMARRWAVLSLGGQANEQHAKALKAAWRSESDASVRRALEKLLERAPFKLTVDRREMRLVPAN